MEPIKFSGWAGGSHNLSDEVPEGYLREVVNADPTPSGALALRQGFERRYAGTDVRGVLALGQKLLLADAGSLVEFDTRTNSSRVLRSIAGGLTGDVLNDRLYFCTASEALEYDGHEVRPWGVPDVRLQPAVEALAGGGMVPGYYQVAMTYTDAWGREGGTDRPVVIRCESGLRVSVPAPPGGYTANVYVSPPDGRTLYLQGSTTGAQQFDFTRLRDDTAQLGTMLLRRPRLGQQVVAHNGILLIADGALLEFTLPLRPHLVDRVRGFVQYPARIGALMSNRRQVFVSADRSYALDGIETDQIAQRGLAEYPAVPGTAVRLPDGRCAWMTQYGQAISGEAGLELPNLAHYAPALGERGAAGVADSHGSQLIVTAMRGRNRGNALASTTYTAGEESTE